MRILYFADTRQIGGAERALVDLAAGKVAAGHEVLLVAPQAEFVEYVQREAPGVRAINALSDEYHDAADQRRRTVALVRQFRALVRIIRGARPDVVHANNGGWPGSDLMRLVPLAARVAGVNRRLITVHSNPWPRGDRVQVVADQLTWRNASAVLCPSEAVLNGLVSRRGMPARLGILAYYGVRTPGGGEGAEDLRSRLVGTGSLLVGMVSARPVPEKGYDVFVDALRATAPSVRGVLVGRYPDGFEQRVSELGLDTRLSLPGLIRDVGAYYHAFDVLVVPSTAEECMPLVILEAAAAGTPTFGSILSGIPEAIEDGESGALFAIGDHVALEGLLSDAAQDPARVTAMGARARARWEARFSLEKMLADHEATYAA